jgi:hypothetical protein
MVQFCIKCGEKDPSKLIPIEEGVFTNSHMCRGCTVVRTKDTSVRGELEFAFTAVTTETGATVGAAVKDEPGYSKLSNMPEFGTYQEAQDYADELNAKLRLTTLDAWKIVASSMRNQ